MVVEESTLRLAEPGEGKHRTENGTRGIRMMRIEKVSSVPGVGEFDDGVPYWEEAGDGRLQLEAVYHGWRLKLMYHRGKGWSQYTIKREAGTGVA